MKQVKVTKQGPVEKKSGRKIVSPLDTGMPSTPDELGQLVINTVLNNFKMNGSLRQVLGRCEPSQLPESQYQTRARKISR